MRSDTNRSAPLKRCQLCADFLQLISCRSCVFYVWPKAIPPPAWPREAKGWTPLALIQMQFKESKRYFLPFKGTHQMVPAKRQIGHLCWYQEPRSDVQYVHLGHRLWSTVPRARGRPSPNSS